MATETIQGKTVQVWYGGASMPVTIRADGCFVGPLGELKLFIGHENLDHRSARSMGLCYGSLWAAMSWTPEHRAAQAARMAAFNRARKGRPRTPMTDAHRAALTRAQQRRRLRERRARVAA